MSNYICPICDSPMEEPPQDWNICDNCGVEFDYDGNEGTIAELRQFYISQGSPKWEYEGEPQWLYNFYVYKRRH